MDRWLAVSTVARRLHVSSRSVRRWIVAGQLPAERSLSGVYQIRASVGAALCNKRLVTDSKQELIKRKPKAPAHGCLPGVYFIKCQGFVKIGIASDLKKRLRFFRTHNPFEVELCLFLPTTSATEATRLERQLHRTFSMNRHRGEWFRECPEISDFIESRTRDLKTSDTTAS